MKKIRDFWDESIECSNFEPLRSMGKKCATGMKLKSWINTCYVLQVWIFVCSQLYFDISLSSSGILSTLDVGIRFLISPWEFPYALTMWNLGRLTLPAECWDTKMGALKCEWPKLYVETPSMRVWSLIQADLNRFWDSLDFEMSDVAYGLAMIGP